MNFRIYRSRWQSLHVRERFHLGDFDDLSLGVIAVNSPSLLAFEAYGLILLPRSGPRIGLMKVREVRNEGVFGARLVG